MASNKKPRRKYVPRPVNREAHLLGIFGCKQLDVHEKVKRAEILRGAVDAITSGRGDQAEWQVVFSAVNMLAALADMPKIISGADAFISHSQDIIANVMDRMRSTGSPALYAEEVGMLRDLLTLWVEVLDVVSRRELSAASDAVAASYKRATSGHPPVGTRVVNGAWA